MRIRTLVILVFVLWPTPRRLFASEPFEFISDLIRSLETCKIANDNIPDGKTNDVMSLMKDIRVFTNKIGQANIQIERHLKSKNELIQESAGAFSSFYKTIVTINEGLLGFLEETHNNQSETASKQGTWLRTLSEITAVNEQLWESLPNAIPRTTMILVDRNRTEAGGKLCCLTITRSERDSLRSDLRRAFGDEITGVKGGRSPIEVSAALLWDFLAKSWKPADAN